MNDARQHAVRGVGSGVKPVVHGSTLGSLERAKFKIYRGPGFLTLSDAWAAVMPMSFDKVIFVREDTLGIGRKALAGLLIHEATHLDQFLGDEHEAWQAQSDWYWNMGYGGYTRMQLIGVLNDATSAEARNNFVYDAIDRMEFYNVMDPAWFN